MFINNMSAYNELDLLLENLQGKVLEYKKNVSLKDYSTFRIGGSADYIVFPYSTESFVQTIRNLKNFEIRYTVIGNGSNILFDDSGYRGVVICTSKMNKITIENESNIVCDCGASFTHLAVIAMKHSLSGLEFAYGIPGTVGGAVYMNAGAYDGETSMVLSSSICYDSDTDEIKTLSATDHMFTYRHSVYTDTGLIILRAVFTLKKGNESEINAKMDDLMSKRKLKQPLEYPSAGSAFKRYPGYYTAKIIDEAGLKGFSVGQAKISEKHAGFIINTGNATSKDVLELISIIKKAIFEKHGIEIETEVRHIV